MRQAAATSAMMIMPMVVLLNIDVSVLSITMHLLMATHRHPLLYFVCHCGAVLCLHTIKTPVSQIIPWAALQYAPKNKMLSSCLVPSFIVCLVVGT